MKFIQKWSYGLAKSLSVSLGESHKIRIKYYHAFQIWVGTAVKISALILVSWLLNSIVPAFFILLSFAVLRVYAGGYHMDTYEKCIITGMILYMLSAVAIRYLSLRINFWLLLIFVLAVSVFCIYSVYRYSPIEHPNRPLKDEEKVKFRKLSIITASVISFVSIAVLILNGRFIALGLACGMLLEISSVVPVGYNLYKRLGESR